MAERIETTIDRLMELVSKENGISTSKAARALGLLPSQVDRIAALLERSGLVKVQYGFTEGRIVPAKPQAQQKTSDEKERRVTVQKVAQRVEREMTGGIDVLRFIEDDLAVKLRNVEDALKKLRESDTQPGERLALFKRELGFVEAQLNELRNEMRKLHLREAEFEGRIQNMREQLRALDSKPGGLLPRAFGGSRAKEASKH